MEKQEFLRRQPRFDLLGTPWQKDPARCPHHQMRFRGTEFRDDRGAHKIHQLFRCDDCGYLHRVPRDVKSAGLRGSIDIDDPLVFRTLIYNKDVDRRYFRDAGTYNEEAQLRYIGRGIG